MELAATQRPEPRWIPDVGEQFAPQVERVIRRLVREEEAKTPADLEEVAKILHTHRHLPQRLSAACRKRLGGRSPDDKRAARALAVGFAACIFPQRSGDLDDVALAGRLAAHAQLWQTLRSEGGGAATAERVLATLRRLERLPDEVANSVTGLLDGLTAASLPRSSEERAARRLGAALYLGTCDRDLIAKIHRGWQEEGDLVAQLRTWFPSPPSRLANLEPEGSGWLDRQRIRSRLERLAGPGPQAVALALEMESSARKLACRVIPPSRVGEEVAELWERIWERLTSGFPYFAFQAYLTYWWRQVVRTHDFHRRERQATQEWLEGLRDRRVEVSPELLRIYREGHRLVRSSFFARKSDDPAAAHERVRQQVDVLWREYLAQALDADRLPSERIEELCEAAGVARQTLYEHLRQLRKRFWAYTLARLGRYTNNEIRHMRRPRGYGKEGASEYPLAKAPGILPITTVARAVLPREILLFAFLSHVFLRHYSDSRYQDPWTAERFFTQELRYWPWRQSMAVMRRPIPCRTAPHVVQALDEAPGEPLRLFLEGGGELPPPEPLSSLVNQLLEGLLTDSDRQILNPRSAQDWRRKVDRHWLVPIWHLAVLEDLDEKAVVVRMRPDAREAKAVLDVAREMRQRTSGGGP